MYEFVKNHAAENQKSIPRRSKMRSRTFPEEILRGLGLPKREKYPLGAKIACKEILTPMCLPPITTNKGKLYFFNNFQRFFDVVYEHSCNKQFECKKQVFVIRFCVKNGSDINTKSSMFSKRVLLQNIRKTYEFCKNIDVLQITF